MTDTNTQHIAELNDKFRRGIIEPRMFDPGAVPGIFIRTRSIAALPGVEQLGIMAAVRDFSAFRRTTIRTESATSARSTSRGSARCSGNRLLLSGPHGGSEDPSDLSQTKRVLTIMLASEY